MNTLEKENFAGSEYIPEVVRQIVELCDPQKIYLYNQRVGLRGQTTSFKLCVVAENGDNQAMEHAIYLEIDCEVPFDVLVYSPEEWERLSASGETFASKIAETGIMLYG